MSYTRDQLERAGGSYWQTADGNKRRVYFNTQALYRFAGVEMELYNTGNIYRCTVNGETISNGAARKLSGKIDFMKLYYDLADGLFHWTSTDNDLASNIVDAIKTRAAEMAA
jgi:hypothetical protein